MKATAFVTVVLIYVLYITSGQAYFNMQNIEAEQNVIAYINENKENNIQMKPISRGEVMDRKEQEIKLKNA
ncbi:MAG: hypothetical protein K0S75_2576 [Clostridia bacterium]|nr:hypothetical protein [Clostridia bacterium]